MNISSCLNKVCMAGVALMMIIGLSGCKKILSKIEKNETVVYVSGYTTGNQGRHVAT